MSRRNLPVALLFALTVGIALGSVYPWPLIPLLSLSAIASATAAYRLYRPAPGSGLVAFVAAALVFGCAAGSVRLQEPAPSWVARHRGQVVELAGVIAGPDEATSGGWRRAVVAVDHLNGAAVERCRVQVISKPSPTALLPGTRVIGAGKLETFAGPANPGDRDGRLSARIQRIHAGLASWNAPLRPLPGRQRLGVSAAIHRLRLALEKVHHQTMPGDAAALLNGIVLGDDQGLNASWRAWFERTGTLHILSVSGLHVSLVGVGIYALLRRLKLPMPAALLPAALASVLYIVMSGARPAAVRAGIMTLTGLAGACFGRKPSAARLLVIAGLIMLALDPLLLFDVGFQLSFAATAGVVWVAPALQSGLGRGRWAALGKTAALSLGAQLTVAPLTACYFGNFTPISLVGNLVMVPLATASLYVGLCASVVGVVWLPPAQWINNGTGVILWALVQSGRLLSRIPGACLPVPAPGPLFIVAYYACLGGLVTSLGREKAGGLVRWRPLLAAVAVAALSFGAWSAAGLFDRSVRVTVLDVGQGSAAFLEMGGKRGLVDAGPLTRGGGSIVSRFLQHKGLRRLNFVVLTHAHADHAGGLPAILADVKVDRLVVPEGIEASPGFADVEKAAGAAKVPIIGVKPGHGMRVGGVELVFLWPPRQYEAGENERSLVFMLRGQENHVLFTGDVGRAELEALAGRYRGRLACDALLLAHHGSVHSLNPWFYDECRPGLAIASVGPNRYGHPSPAVIGELRSSGCEVWLTQSEGAIELSLNREGMRKTAWRRRGLFGLWLWRGE